MFQDLKIKVQERFAELSKDPVLFYVDIDRDQVWDQYLNGFSDPADRQSYNCSCCRSFLRQYAGIVAIRNNKRESIWEGISVPGYEQTIKNLVDYINSLPITNVFYNDMPKCGTDKTPDGKKEGVIWQHFYIILPNKFLLNKAALDTVRGEKRDNKNMLERALNELKLDATETVLELIAQNSLYRGREFEGVLQEFLKLQKEFLSLPSDQLENYCWVKSTTISPGLSRVRNTAIGTLLINLSQEMELDAAVGKFEAVMAPANYKRPTSLVTPKMVAAAKEQLTTLGLVDSLERRLAKVTDLNTEDMLFIDKPSVGGDVFDEMSKETHVNPKTLTKMDEIGVEEFIKNVVPGAKKIEVLVENRHLGNMVSLVTAKNPTAPTLFKWSNPFSWSYTGGVTDSIKERVKEAGGSVTGELRVSLAWGNYDDLDLHVVEPNGNRIWFRNKATRHPSSGMLDVDMNAGSGTSRQPVENIIWDTKQKMQEGTYRVEVNQYNQRETKGTGYIVQVECGGEQWEFEKRVNPKTSQTDLVVEFNYSKTNGVTLQANAKTSVVSKEKWGVSTNQFHKVVRLMLSPNYWGKNPSGNKHYLFMLEDAQPDESVRPFFNEFLKPEFEPHRKVFEIIGSKVPVEATGEQLAGVGFSETQDNSVIVRVEGAFKRTLKVIF